MRIMKQKEEKEVWIKQAIQAVKSGDFPSLNRTVVAYNIPLTTLQRRLAVVVSCALAHLKATIINSSRRKGSSSLYIFAGGIQIPSTQSAC